MMLFTAVGTAIGLFSAAVGIAFLSVAIYLGVIHPGAGLFWLAVLVWWGWRIKRWVDRQKAAQRAVRRATYIRVPAYPKKVEDLRPNALARPRRNFDSRRVHRAE